MVTSLACVDRRFGPIQKTGSTPAGAKSWSLYRSDIYGTIHGSAVCATRSRRSVPTSDDVDDNNLIVDWLWCDGREYVTRRVTRRWAFVAVWFTRATASSGLSSKTDFQISSSKMWKMSPDMMVSLLASTVATVLDYVACIIGNGSPILKSVLV